MPCSHFNNGFLGVIATHWAMFSKHKPRACVYSDTSDHFHDTVQLAGFVLGPERGIDGCNRHQRPHLPQMRDALSASLCISFSFLPCRKRKIHTQSPQQAEMEAKQALMPVQEYNPAKPQKPEPPDQKSGDVMVQWKDGTITSLYTEASEDAI